LNKVIEGQPGIQINKLGCPISIEAFSGGYRWGLDTHASKITGTEPLKNEFSHVMDAAGHAARKIFPLVKLYQPVNKPAMKLPPSPMSS